MAEPPSLRWWQRVLVGVAVALLAACYGLIGASLHRTGLWHWVLTVVGVLVGLFLGAGVCAMEADSRKRRWQLKRTIEILENSPWNNPSEEEE